MKKTLTFTFLTLAACAPAARGPDAEDRSALSAPGGDQCAMITPESFDNLVAILDAALIFAEQDVAANAVTGRYGDAALGAREGLINAKAHITIAREAYDETVYAYDPPFVPYNVGSWTATGMKAANEQIQEAIHWGAISAIYHVSYEAKEVVEYSLQAIEVANELHAHGVRCNVDAYFP